ncbi:YdeI/OmpD-associated family protein [Mariniflexile litorale]|uniref:YdeI/OmpD-associated family protein n=1 Tax=Mariniflexile litorale TaxID=3045158 RepID=A0AAU7E9X8_9FLAO|nr:YdeI/OmpD-associated family protein [Mariniflexile sp. KMM 9835]MDQ8212602.1 YdeI/OmpD-associated family protein [Mariniflexile sp. KMM 9835]
MELPELYFKTDTEWREWLHNNHKFHKGVYLIFYKVEHERDSMRWEEAVKVALCYGWIDSTVKSLGEGKRRQYFTPRNPKSVWSALNKKYIETLIFENLMHDSGLEIIKIAKQNGSWTALDTVEKGIIPDDLQIAFDKNAIAFNNYKNFAPSYRKSYLYWLNQAKREDTRKKRIHEIIQQCANNIKTRDTR